MSEPNVTTSTEDLKKSKGTTPRTKLRSAGDLTKLRAALEKKRDPKRTVVTVCGGTGCLSNGSEKVAQAFVQAISQNGLKAQVEIKLSGCHGFCEHGPLVTIDPQGIFYERVGRQQPVEDATEIVEATLKKGELVDRFRYADPITGEKKTHHEEIPFYAKQHRIVLRHNGRIDPGQIEDYLVLGGYSDLAKALTMKPDQIIAEIEKSGLRGRGGAGFPTGRKWQFARAAAGDQKFIVCNADEGDPGAYMDRSIMEGNPHSVLEGMIIGAYAITGGQSAAQGYIYVRHEYPLAVRNLEQAIAQAEEYGLLGDNILGSGFNFRIKINRGGGAFVCGEETALIASLEGRPGEPRQRPPFPAEKGLWGKPTVINNVETWANVPWILAQGTDTFRKLGTQTSKGSKVFSVVGKINNSGLIEVPMGIKLGEIIYDIGGGIPKNKKFKAIQTGGPSGGCIPTEYLNLPVDYESLTQVGAIMGSGGMIVMDEDTCMVDLARYFLDFLKDESCGKCSPCREGIDRALEILTRICQGQGRAGDIEMLQKIGQMMKGFALCALGNTAPNPILSTIRYFREEYEAHIHDHRCPAGVCSALFKSPCQNACPVGMDIPAYIALVRAGRVEDAYKVLKRTNPFPSVCGRICGHLCQSKCRRGQLDEPLAIMHLKRFVSDNARKPKAGPLPVTQKEKIAVVGAGPAGLTAALELKKRGYAVTVFEELPQPGGMLRWGIPAYRLPREILDREIQDILDTGVELRTSTRVGREVSFAELDKKFDILFLAVGAHHSYKLDIPGEYAEGMLGAVEMLRAYNLGQKVKIGKKVAVIGGGNSAVDASRTALRLGAKSVTIYYRRERKDMPAQEAEIQAAEAEGVQIEYLVGPVEVVKQKGKVSGLKLTRMQLGAFDRSGRKTPEPISGSEFTVDVDMVIPAISQAADLSFLPKGSGVETSRTAIKVDEKLKTQNAKVWAGGDAVSGPAMVIDAIQAGRQAAQAIDETIRAATGQKPWAPIEEPIEIPFEVEEEVLEQPQMVMPEAEAAQRKGDFREVELGYSMQMALTEACRCLRCDVKI